MNIDEAIELIQQDIDGGYYAEGSAALEAVGLSIEALKSIQLLRNHLDASYVNHLPGETKD